MLAYEPSSVSVVTTAFRSGNPEGGAKSTDLFYPELKRLAAGDDLPTNPVIRTVVEKKVFEGYMAQEIAQQLGCATFTINRHWQFARHWMRSEI